jgi:hypothetical protein
MSAVTAATMRITISLAKGYNAATTYKRTWLKHLEEEIVGACGEKAFAAYLGQYFVPSVNTFHEIPDVGEVEVRSTTREDGCLIVRDNDHDDRPFVLAIVTPPMVELKGWMRGCDAKSDRYKRNPNGHREAWFVPQCDLIPMEELR